MDKAAGSFVRFRLGGVSGFVDHTILDTCSLETCKKSVYDSQTEHDTEMKCTSIDCSHQVAEGYYRIEARGCKPWVTNLSIVPHTLGILTANITYCIILLEYCCPYC